MTTHADAEHGHDLPTNGDDLPSHQPVAAEPASPRWLPLLGAVFFATALIWWLSTPSAAEEEAAAAAASASASASALASASASGAASASASAPAPPASILGRPAMPKRTNAPGL